MKKHFPTPVLLPAIVLLLALNSMAWGQGMPRGFGIGTDPRGSLYYAAGDALGRVLSNHLPVPARVQPYAGTSIVLPLINNGELELGVNNANDSRMAYQGLKPSLASPRLRLASVLFPLRVAALVRHNASIRTVAGLRGRRVAGGFRGQLILWYNATSILANGGLGWRDVKRVPTANGAAGVKALIEGKVDATFLILGAGRVREANTTIAGGVRFLSLNTGPREIRAMRRVMPGAYWLEVKKGSTPGVREKIAVAASDVFLVTGTHLGEAAISAVVKALFHNEKEIQGAAGLLGVFSRKQMVKRNVTIPYHPGAVKAYREVGLWSTEMDRVQTRLLREAAK